MASVSTLMCTAVCMLALGMLLVSLVRMKGGDELKSIDYT